MRYLITLTSSQPPSQPPAELFEGIMKLGEDAVKAGVLLDTAGLAPSNAASRVSLTGGKLSVTDGPFTEAKEMLSYALYEVRSKAEAIEWTERFMALHRDCWPGWEGEATIHQAFGPADFNPPAQ
jgi:hypothetical protein